MNSVDYLNKNKFKFVIDLVGNYGDGAIDYSGSIETILNRLNSIGYKNTFGYEITLLTSQSSLSLTTEKEVYKVRGTTNDEKVFKNPEVIPISGN